MINKDLIRRVRELERDNAELRQRAANTPILIKAAGGAAASVDRLTIDSGNTLATGQYGIKFVATPITNVAVAYDPTTPGAAIDGIGWAQLIRDGVFVSYVLACNDNSSGTDIGFDLLGTSPSGLPVPDVCSVARTKTVTVGGDPLVTLLMYVVRSLVG